MSINEEILNEMRQINANLGASPDVLADNPFDPKEDWLIIPFEFDLDANGSTVQSLIISNEYSFDLVYLTGHITDHPEQPPAAPVLPNLQLTLSDGRDKYLTRGGALVHWLDLIGTQPAAALATPNAPYTFVGRRRFAAGSNITLEVEDLSGVDSVVRFVMHGILVYTEKADRR